MEMGILILTLAGALLLRAWFHGDRITISAPSDFFMLAWFYYGFAVPLDMLLGIEITPHPHSPDFSEPEIQPLVIQGMLMYLACGAAFFLAARLMRRPESATLDSGPRYGLRLPPVWMMVAIHLATLSLYGGDFLYMSRQERFALTGESTLFRYLFVLLILVRALDLIYLLTSRNPKRIALVAAMAVAVSAVTGDRTGIAVIAVCIMVRWPLPMRRITYVAAGVAAIAALALWKTLYSYTIELYLYGVGNVAVFDHFSMSLLGIDGYTSFMILTTYLPEGSPLWMGSSYLVTPILVALPRALRTYSVSTLSEQYTLEMFPDLAENGFGTGFSAVAEAWLNFGLAGPVMLGLAWGLVSRLLESRDRSVALVIFAIMSCFLFRSDFATMCKLWIVIYGGSMVAVYGLLIAATGRRIDSHRLRPAGAPPLHAGRRRAEVHARR